MGWDISECHPEIITGAEDQDTFRLKVHSFLLCISCNRNTQCNNLQNVTSFFFFFFFFFGPAQLQSREHQKCLKKIIALFSVAAAKGAHIRWRQPFWSAWTSLEMLKILFLLEQLKLGAKTEATASREINLELPSLSCNRLLIRIGKGWWVGGR